MTDATPQTVLSHSRTSVALKAVLIQPPSAFRADEYQRSPLPLRPMPLPGLYLSTVRPG